jgi:hypothetical protein
MNHPLPDLIADGLREYISRKGIGSDQRILSILYTAGREVVNKEGKKQIWSSDPNHLSFAERHIYKAWSTICKKGDDFVPAQLSLLHF